MLVVTKKGGDKGGVKLPDENTAQHQLVIIRLYGCWRGSGRRSRLEFGRRVK